MSTFDPSGEGIELLAPLRARVVAPWKEWWLGCDEGWWPLLARLAEDLTEISPGWSLRQAKQKFAELRFVASAGTLEAGVVRRFQARVAVAEQEAVTTCERCGELGALRRSETGYLKVLCASCVESDASVKWSADAHRATLPVDPIDVLPGRPTGFWKATTEHGTTFYFLFDEERSGWMRVEAPIESRPVRSAQSDSGWRTLRWGPCLSEWPTGASRPEPVGDEDGFPVRGLAVGQAFWIGESMFADRWWSTTVVAIQRLDRADLPAEVRLRLKDWQQRQAQADEDG